MPSSAPQDQECRAGARGSHRVYRHPDLREKVNLQPLGRQAKSYQVRQVVELVERYSLEVESDR